MDYRITGKDDGYNEAAAIQPVLNGEDANQTTFQRPSENLRTRSEVVRKTVDNILAEMQVDRGLCVMSGADAKVYFSFGKLRVNAAGTNSASDRDIVLVPISAAGTAIPAMYYYADGVLPNQGKFKVVAKSTIFAHNGGNNLWIKIFKDARTLVSPVVTIEGAGGGGTYPADGPITICVEIDKDDLHTIEDVVTALNLAPSSTYVDATTIAYGTNAVAVRIQRIFSSDAGSMAAVDSECYRITAAEIDNFFQLSGLGKTMASGDSLVIAFPTVEERRACTYNTAIGTYLRIISEDSRDLAGGHVVPICRYYLSRLVFANGKAFEASTPDYLVISKHSQNMDDLASTSLGDSLVGAEAKSTTHLTLSSGTVHSQLSALADLGVDTTGASGDAKIGAYSLSAGASGGGSLPLSLATGSVRDHAQALLTALDNHIDGSEVSYHHLAADITGHPFVVVAAVGGDYSTLQAAVTALAGAFGGTIYTYLGATSLVIPSLAGPLTIIGHNTPIITGTTSYACSLTNTSGGLLKFVNMKFQITGSNNVCVVYGVSGDSKVQFVDCEFSRGYASATVAGIFLGCSAVFEGCTFTGGFSATATAYTIEISNGNSGVHVDLSVQTCEFVGWYRLLDLQTSNHVMRNLVLKNNVIDRCGTADGTVTTVPTLITNTYPIEWCDISGNVFVGAADTKFAYVCNISACGGRIAGNFVDCAPLSPSLAPAAAHYLIQAAGTQTNGGRAIVIESNVIICGGYVGAIKGDIHTLIRGNSIEAFGWIFAGSGPAFSFCAISQVDVGTIEGNQIFYDDASSNYANIYMILGNLKSVIQGNHVYGGLNVLTNGIKGGAVISGNYLAAGVGSSGIGIEGNTADSVISNNLVDSFGIGLKVHGKTVATGNLLCGPDKTLTGRTGILCTDHYAVLTGNIVHTFYTGIDFASKKVAAAGNMVYDSGAGTNVANAGALAGIGPLAAAWPGTGANFDIANWNYLEL